MPKLRTEKVKVKFSKLHYKRLFETAGDGILILDAELGKILEVNPSLKKLLGFSNKELFTIINSKIPFAEIKENLGIYYRNLQLITKDNKKIIVEFVSSGYMVNRKHIIQCNIRDITDRMVLEKIAKTKSDKLEELTNSQEETRKAMLNIMEDLEGAKKIIELEKVKDEAMLASIGEGLIAVDNNKRIIIINKAAELMLGWKMDDVIGKKITSFNLEDENGKKVALNKRPTQIALSIGKTVESICYFVRADKTRFPISIIVTPIKLDGKIIGALDVFRDITREQEIDKSKSEFVSLASHQLRTPLGIVKWYLEALENEEYFKKAPPQMRKYFNEIYKSNERVLSLVHDLLSVSRIDQGKIKNDPILIDVVIVIKEIVEQMQILARKKNISLNLDMQKEKIPNIKIDISRFREVVENLLGNAVEYTTPPGSVRVLIKKVDGNLFLKVKDTGIGIPKNDQKMLFTKFFRSEKAISYNPEGSGLGLYVVKSYVEDWNGKISFQSIEEKGSTFTISLPIGQPRAEPRGGELK